MKAKESLLKHKSCSTLLEWIGDRSIEEMVIECPKGDWLLWSAIDAGVDPYKISRAKMLCVQQVIFLMKKHLRENTIRIIGMINKTTNEEHKLLFISVLYNNLSAFVRIGDKTSGLNTSANICRSVFAEDLIVSLSKTL